MVGRVRDSIPSVIVASAVALFALLAMALLAQEVHAATLNCEIRAESACLSNQTLFLRLNSSEVGSAPNNSHAQLANYTGAPANWSVCCWTDAFRTLNNTCAATSTRVLGLESTNNSHVQVGSNTTYAWSACMNVTYGNVSCTYDNTACTSGYTSILSIASSEHPDNTSNAHLSAPGYYLRQVCCKVGGQTPPVVAFADLTPINTTKRYGLICENGSVTDVDGDLVTLHYNWYVNGTSITVLNLPMDYDDTAGVTHDISGHANHATVTGATFLPTGGEIGGAFSIGTVTNDHITIGNASDLAIGTGPFSISLWVYSSAPQVASLVDKKNGTGIARGYGLFLAGGGTPRFIVADGSSSATASGSALSNSVWTYVVGTRNSSGIYLYQDGSLVGSSASGGGFDLTNVITLRLGANSSLLDNYFNGRLDEVIIFNRSLSADEVSTLYNHYNKRLNQSELVKGDFWNCSITPVDSTGINGSTVRSNQSYVNASAPAKVNLTYPLHNNQSVFERFVNFSWTQAEEPDGDQVNYTFSLTVTPGTCSIQATRTNLLVNHSYEGELCVDQMYNWTVNACDVDGCSGNTTISNFTIASLLAITMVNNNTNFGVLALGQSITTDNQSVLPFLLRNDGNVQANITLAGNNSPFSSVALGDTAFQFKVADNETGAINQTGSQLTYAPVPATLVTAIRQLNYTDSADVAAVHINLTVPLAEPPGQKEANLTFHATMN